MTKQQVKARVRDQMLLVPGVSHVETKRGGVPIWITVALPGQSHWEIHVRRVQRQGIGVGPVRFDFYDIEIKGWMPYAYENPDTTPIWEDLTDAVQERLIEHPSLELSVNDLALPQEDRNDFEWVNPAGASEGGENQPALWCHTVLINARARVFARYYTS